MDPEEINEILLRAVLNYWVRQAYIQVWYSEGRTYKEICETFERMEIA